MVTKDDIQEKVLALLEDKSRATVALSGGTGKTLIGLKHMASKQFGHCRFLVVAPKKSIFESWKDDAKKFNLEYLLENITFSTYLSLNKQSHDYDGIYLDKHLSIAI